MRGGPTKTVAASGSVRVCCCLRLGSGFLVGMFNFYPYFSLTHSKNVKLLNMRESALQFGVYH